MRMYVRAFLLATLLFVASACAPIQPQSDTTPCTILLPLAYNDGSPVPEDQMEQMKQRLLHSFGGYTIEGEKESAYRRQDTGATQVEKLLQITIAVPTRGGVAHLRQLLQEFGRELDQEAMNLEIRRGSRVEFVTGNSR